MKQRSIFQGMILMIFVIGAHKTMAEVMQKPHEKLPYEIQMKMRAECLRELAQSLEQCAQEDADAIYNGKDFDSTAWIGRPSSLELLVIPEVVGLQNQWYLEHIKTVYINRYNILTAGKLLLPNIASFSYRDSLVREFNTYALQEAVSAERWIKDWSARNSN